MSNDPILEIQEVISHYDIGELVDYEKNERGYVNTSFEIFALKQGARKKYFFRKYKKGVKEDELKFEHSIVDRLCENQRLPVAKVHRTRDGKSYFQRLNSAGGNTYTYYAIFDFLPGDDRYTWVSPKCNEVEVVQSARLLAQFHDALFGFQPAGSRVEPKILDLLPEIHAYTGATAKNSKHTVFDDYLQENLEQQLRSIEQTFQALASPEARNMLQTIIHCDYHPGNLKFTGDEITGLFDFDWAKVDARCFDVGLALWYFFASWSEKDDGEMDLDGLQLFLRTYQETLRGSAGLQPLNQTELKYLPEMINAGNLYILNWTLLDFFNKEVDPEEYLVYLKHNVNSTRWYEAGGREKLREAIVNSG